MQNNKCNAVDSLVDIMERLIDISDLLKKDGVDGKAYADEIHDHAHKMHYLIRELKKEESPQ